MDRHDLVVYKKRQLNPQKDHLIDRIRRNNPTWHEIHNIEAVEKAPYRKTSKPRPTPEHRNIVFQIVIENRPFGLVGAVLLLPGVTTSGFLALLPPLDTPYQLGFVILANLAVCGSLGYILGSASKAYEYTSRIFLALVIVGLALAILIGIVYVVIIGLMLGLILLVLMAAGLANQKSTR